MANMQQVYKMVASFARKNREELKYRAADIGSSVVDDEAYEAHLGLMLPGEWDANKSAAVKAYAEVYSSLHRQPARTAQERLAARRSAWGDEEAYEYV